MTRAKIGELKNHLSRYLARVREGEEIVVMDRDTAIARIVPVRGATDAKTSKRARDEARLGDLERRGIIRRGSGNLPAWFRKDKPKAGKGGVLDLLLRERKEGW